MALIKLNAKEENGELTASVEPVSLKLVGPGECYEGTKLGIPEGKLEQITLDNGHEELELWVKFDNLDSPFTLAQFMVRPAPSLDLTWKQGCVVAKKYPYQVGDESLVDHSVAEQIRPTSADINIEIEPA